MEFPLSVERESIRRGVETTRIVIPRIIIKEKSRRIFGSLNGSFLDTGCPKSIIYPRDSEAIGIDVRKLRRTETPKEIMVTPFQDPVEIYPLKNVRLSLLNRDGESKRIQVDKVYVLGILKSELSEYEFYGRSEKAVKGMPSLIGPDLLEDAGLALHFDPQDNEAYLEDD